MECRTNTMAIGKASRIWGHFNVYNGLLRIEVHFSKDLFPSSVVPQGVPNITSVAAS